MRDTLERVDPDGIYVLQTDQMLTAEQAGAIKDAWRRGIKEGLVIIGGGLTVRRLDGEQVWWFVNDLKPVPVDDLLPTNRSR